MKKALFLLLPLLLPLTSWADDSGLGIEVNTEKKICKGFNASINAEFRTQDGLNEAERWSLGAGLDYKFSKWLKGNAGYIFINRHLAAYNTNKYHYEADWQPRHRAFASMTGSWEVVKHFELSLRERYQYTYTTPINLERHYLSTPEVRASDKIKEGEDEHLLRSRLQLKYSRKKCAWQPYASVEILNSLTDGFANDQMRYTLGTDYKINKQNQLGLSYRYKDKNNRDDSKGHLLTISYSYDF